MNNKEIIYPRFLNNKPCGEDLFEGKSHEKIAKNVANIISKDSVKIIGLDGGWGSGKSNMVNLIKSELDKKYHFFIYDAWGHQEDLQRRSILEELTEYLTKEDNEKKTVLNKKKWSSKLKTLLAKKREVETKTIPKISCGVILTALAIIVAPILDSVTSNLESLTCKIIIKSIPLGILILLILGLFLKNFLKYRKHKSVCWRFKTSLSEAFSIYTDKQKEDTTFETISEDEPSSRKFKKWMHDIDKDLINNKLVIVFDNMDRLPHNKVQELWASIHTFFAEEKYENIYVIVPFDREHIKSAFKQEDISTHLQNNSKNLENEKDYSPIEKVSDNKAEVICYGNDFINKTFDTVYRVSPPIMSDWKTYFANRWKEAFNSDVSSEVTQIYDLLSKVITPRNIIAFINEFVSIRQVSDNSIPDKYIALFVFGKDKIVLNPEIEILKPTYLGNIDFIYKNDEELPKYMSALYYQLSTEKALDIVYTEKLKRALNSNDVYLIKTIQSNINVFFSILENAITSISNISNAVIALDECLSSENSELTQLAWSCVYKQEKEIKDYLQDYQKILIQHISNKEEYLKKLVTAFCKLVIKDIDIIKYYDSIRQLSEIEGINPFKYLERVKIDASTFIRFVEEAKKDYEKYKFICDEQELNNYLQGIDIQHLGELKAIPYIKDKYNLKSYSDKLKNLLDNNINNKDSVEIIFNRFKEIERPLKNKLPDNKISSYFSSTTPENEFYYDFICMRISRLNNFNSSYQSYFNNIINSTDDNIVEKVAERIEYYINYGEILLNIDQMDYPLFKAVAKKITEKSYGQSQMDILNVLNKYEIIKNKLEITPEILIDRLNPWNKSLQDETINNIKSISLEFFTDAINVNNELTNHCIDIAKSYLESKTKEEWKQLIINKDFEYQLLLIIKHNIQNCFDAFSEVILDKIIGNNKLQKDIIDKLINFFKSYGREFLVTFNNVRDCFCDKGATMTNDLFDCFGESLLKYAKLEDKQSTLRTIFPTLILDKEENIKLLLNYQDKMIKIVEISGEENKDFKYKINDLLEGKYKDDHNFEEFANGIGVYKSKSEQQEDVE